ncbi:MAG: cyclic lactone autoinducer peptide [Oscillospiraceae bacterium]|nr:cyclic lactone autoinducer peptide [Oscillospiraceae bacterium]
MNKRKTAEFVGKVVAKVLRGALYVEANSTSSPLLYQPKAPKALSQFKKK